MTYTFTINPDPGTGTFTRTENKINLSSTPGTGSVYTYSTQLTFKATDNLSKEASKTFDIEIRDCYHYVPPEYNQLDLYITRDQVKSFEIA